MKIKNGDRVRCIQAGEYGAGWKLGLEFIAERVLDINGGIAFGAVEGHGVYFNSLELVEEENTSEEPKLILLNCNTVEEWIDACHKLNINPPVLVGWREPYCLHISREDEHFGRYCTHGTTWVKKGNHRIVKYEDWVKAIDYFMEFINIQ